MRTNTSGFRAYPVISTLSILDVEFVIEKVNKETAEIFKNFSLGIAAQVKDLNLANIL